MTQRRSRVRCTLVCCLLFVSAGALAQTLQIIDAEGHATSLTMAQLSGLPHVSVNVHDHDKDAQFEGVALAPLLATAGIQLGDALRGPRMSEVLMVEAADGYKVVFALAEVDPAFATREIILAFKRNGTPMDAREGPLRIVAPGDKRPARWIRQVTTLKIVTPR